MCTRKLYFIAFVKGHCLSNKQTNKTKKHPFKFRRFFVCLLYNLNKRIAMRERGVGIVNVFKKNGEL